MAIDIQDDEHKIIEAYIFLPLVRKVLERDKRAIEKSAVKFKGPYLKSIDYALKRLSNDLGKVKSEIGKKKIRLHRINELDYDVWVRGWEHKKNYHPQIAAKRVEEKINYYINKTPDQETRG